MGKYHFGRRNIDPWKFSLFLISKILVSLRNCSPDRKCIIWMQFFFEQLKQYWNQIIIYKYTFNANFRRGMFWHYSFSHPAPPGGAKNNFFYLVTGTKLESMKILMGYFRRWIFCHYLFWYPAPPGGVIGGQNFKFTIWEGAHRTQEIP